MTWGLSSMGVVKGYMHLRNNSGFSLYYRNCNTQTGQAQSQTVAGSQSIFLTADMYFLEEL